MGKSFNTGTLVNGLTVLSNGNVGIGITPSSWRNTNKVLQINNSSLYDENGTNLWLGLNFFENTSGSYIYTNNGHVTAYRQQTGQHNWFTSTSGTAGNTVTFTNAMTLTSGGNLGIGTSNPVGPLDIAVPAIGSAIGATNAQTAYDYSRLRIKHYTESNLGLSIGYAGANWTYIQACYNNGTTAPLLLNAYGGEVRVGAGGLKFSNGSTALNYYEEGTFTPNNLNSNMSAVTPTFGRYVRIGNQVTINVRWSVEPGGTGQKYLVFNLPFAFNIASGVSYTGSVSNYNSGLSAYSSNVGTSVRNSSSSDTQQYVEAVFISNTSTTMLFSMTYFTF